MKIRDGFVSNSSSASFIVSFKSSLSYEEISELICKSDEWLAKRWNETTGQRLKFASINNVPQNLEYEDVEVDPASSQLQKDGGEYTFSASTTMFNDWYDVPGALFFRALYEERVPDTMINNIIQTEDEMQDIREEVAFDPICWEYDLNIVNPWNNRKEEEVAKAKKIQKHQEMAFLDYLASIKSKLSPEEEITLAKYQLGK